jgi:hypothetical protein
MSWTTPVGLLLPSAGPHRTSGPPPSSSSGPPPMSSFGPPPPSSGHPPSSFWHRYIKPAVHGCLFLPVEVLSH